jgi:hypothetical protein
VLSLDPTDTLLLCRRLLGLSLLISGVEHVRIASLLPTQFPLGATFGARAQQGILRVLMLAFGQRIWVGLVAMQTLLAAFLLLTGQGVLLLPLLFLAWLGCVRFRGSFNGGSDTMTFVVGLPLAVQTLFPERPAVAGLAIAAVATQLILSYLLAGVAKLREPMWRNGYALTILINREHYQVPPWFKRFAAMPALSRLLTRAVLVFECAAPLALLHRNVCYGYLALAFCFHLGNAVTLGLNRFVWAWLAAFPCLPALATMLSAIAPG